MAIKHFPSAKISASSTHSVKTETTAGAPSSTIEDGSIAVDTTNDAFYFRSGAAWRQAGASVTVADAPPSSPSDGDMWFESDTGNTLVYYTDANTSQWVEIGHTPDSSHEFFISVDGGVPDSNYGGISTIDGGTV